VLPSHRRKAQRGLAVSPARKGLAVVVVAVVAVAALGRFAWTGLEVSTGFAAKLVCSLTLTSGQSADAIRAELLDQALAPVSSLLSLKPADCCASANLFGFVSARAVHRRGLGCTLLAGRDERDLESLPEMPERPVLDAAAPWPRGGAGPVASPDSATDVASHAATRGAIDSAIDEAFRETDETGSGNVRQTKAVVIAHRGNLIAERYADGYSASTPMISWSMAKSVLAALAGIAVSEGRLSLDAPAPVPEWAAPGDPRRAITLDQLLRMSSGLRFDETYGAVNDVSRMLFTEPDMGAYAARMPLDADPDTAWSYSSGTSNIVARMLRDSFGGDVAAFVRYSRERLFDAAAMTSAFLEHDATGTPVGSSFVFMTARDWARFGELHRNDGVTDGRRVLPDGWVRYVTKPTAHAPQGSYGAHWWLNAGEAGDADKRPWPSLPADAYAARGYSGQWLLVVPSRELVLVRLGISFPDAGKDGTVELATKVLAALGER